MRVVPYLGVARVEYARTKKRHEEAVPLDSVVKTRSKIKRFTLCHKKVCIPNPTSTVMIFNSVCLLMVQLGVIIGMSGQRVSVW